VTGQGGVLLVCMPFGHVFAPSIGLSLLKAGLAAQDIPARVRYYSIPFAERIGQHFYYGLSAQSRPPLEDLAGEWIFSSALFGAEAANEEEEYVEKILRGRARRPSLIERIRRARAEAGPFLEWCLEDVLRVRPQIVGFTSMFQQHVASLALARRIKQALPGTFVVFGGANCGDVMGAETVRQFPFVDAAVSGEADLVFPDLARRVLEGRPVDGLPGVRTRAGIAAEFAGGRFSPAPMVRALDALPYPDYGDYFEQFERSRFGRAWQPSIFFETSRGCWWGERMHCTFCGLNGQTMAFRSKSAPRALDELAALAARHPGCDIQLTDNILDMGYFADFLPALAGRRPDAELFYEVKANLKKDQLRKLREAGIRAIQPGIESLSDPVLKLMRKGVSALQNVQFLKWCKELGIAPDWNILWGFPGEPPEEYARMAGLVPLLSHLRPPVQFGTIRVDRFSPNFFDAERLGFTDLSPLPAYGLVYPLPDAALQNLAYYFSFAYREPRDVGSYVTTLKKRLRAWRRTRPGVELFSVDTGDSLLVWDLRPVARAPLTRLSGPDRILYQACDSASDLRQLGERLAADGGSALPAEEIERRLECLAERRLLVRDGPRYLALAVPMGEYSPPASAVERFYGVVRRLGRKVPGGWVVPSGTVRASRRRSRGPRDRARRPARAGTARRLAPSQFSVDEQGNVTIRRISHRRA